MNATNDWRDDADSVKDKLKYILSNENTQQDVVIVVGSGSLETVVKAHGLILILGSQVFQKVLETAKVNNEGFKEIKLPDVSPDALKFVLKYIYTDCVTMEDENALDILYVSLKFKLRRLAVLCISKLLVEISAQNVLRIFEEAMKMNVPELVQASEDFIFKNARDVFEREDFLNINKECLFKLLASDELQIDEVSLFKILLSWGEAECERLKRKKHSGNVRYVLGKLLPLIRFTQMTSDQFATVVVKTNILDAKEIIDVYNYLCASNSNTNVDIAPPQWISSASARKHGESENAKKKRLLRYLQEIKQKKTIGGLFCTKQPDIGIQTIANITGMQPGILTLKMPRYCDGVAKWLSFTTEIISHWNNGFLIRIVWCSSSINEHPLTRFAVLETTDEIDETKWQNLMKDNSQFYKEWKTHLDAIVPYFKLLQNAGVVVICDLLPCINRIDYFRIGRPVKNGTLKLYQMTHDYLTQRHHLNSILWTWSVSIYGDMSKLDDFWPGDNYVDIASVYMQDKKPLEMELYHKLLDVVGNKPISMECIYSVPTPALLTAQPGWTWFSVRDDLLNKIAWNNDQSIKDTFNSLSVISKENKEFFKTSQ